MVKTIKLKDVVGNKKEANLLKQIKAGLKDVADIKSGKIERVTLTQGLKN